MGAADSRLTVWNGSLCVLCGSKNSPHKLSKRFKSISKEVIKWPIRKFLFKHCFLRNSFTVLSFCDTETTKSVKKSLIFYVYRVEFIEELNNKYKKTRYDSDIPFVYSTLSQKLRQISKYITDAEDATLLFWEQWNKKGLQHTPLSPSRVRKRKESAA